MMLGIIAALASAWLLGALCVGVLWPRERVEKGDIGLIIWPGLGVGLGLTSILFLVASLISERPSWIWGIELLISAVLAHRLWSSRSESRTMTGKHGGNLLETILGFVFVQGCVVAVVVAVRAYGAQPFSSSDGWTIWNMHARIIHRSGTNWPDVLAAPQLLWTHPDYPLLVPLSVARCLAITGNETPVAAGVVSILFGAATLGVAVSTVTRLRNRVTGYIGGLILLGTPFFITFSANQHADIPLGFYVLAAVSLIAMPGTTASGWRVAAVAGSMAGFAAWTKNEGLLFVWIAGMGWLLRRASTSRMRTFGGFLAGLLLTLGPVAAFKLALAPVNDIVASSPWSRWPDLLDWNRHRLILAAIWRDVGRFGEWHVAPFLAMLLPLVGRTWRRLDRNELVVLVVIGLVLAGYYSVYLFTPMDLEGHLSSSLVRLLMQLWPAVVFVWCLALPYDHWPVASTTPAFQRKWKTPATLATGVAMAAVILILFERQLPANQLATTPVGGGRADIFVGDGWYGPERHDDDVWVWSRGESNLLVRVEAAQTLYASLQFTIRTLVPRTVTARIGQGVVWESMIDENASAMRISGLRLPPGETRIAFETDGPGVPESDAPDARKLTFALYNPAVTIEP